MSRHPGDLPWSAVDPAHAPFDLRKAGEAAGRVRPGSSKGEIQTALDEAFREACGPWAGGWLWGRGESEFDGGPGPIWCCEDHCVLLPGEGLEATVARALEALQEWRRHLERVARLFADLPRPAEPRHFEEAALELVAFAVEETTCESGWSSYASTLLGWYLQFLGAAPELAARLADEALKGRFESWVSPSEEAVRGVASDFGLAAARALG